MPIVKFQKYHNHEVFKAAAPLLHLVTQPIPRDIFFRQEIKNPEIETLS